MKIFDKQSAKNFIIGQVRAGDVMELETDDYGQLIVSTNIYKWSDGSLRDESEPKTETTEEQLKKE